MASVGQLLTFVATGESSTYQSTLSPYINNGTFTPTLDGSTPGTTTYTTQIGHYSQIGNMIFLQATIVITGATGTGIMLLGGFPFTLNGSTFNYSVGPINFIGGISWPFLVGTTSLTLLATPGFNYGVVECSGSANNGGAMQMANANLTLSYNIFYTI